ncbi:DUF3014 domain-containing protein [Parahaliea sp. F7430]|uniref:DUF3014 domain-containing protein n=1 Tax=Sediminihaliea albiluteola TaxID=2758564 RepID=A0A7W2YJI1_9GAMM|nr:DUF3014 domain-containing protein [Sediminihaliea albiluteola]MBA6413135.1 DUF3014 domain-containing protein [Sediminihaliea albiluteola]
MTMSEENNNRSTDEQPEEHMTAMPEERLNREVSSKKGFPIKHAVIVLAIIAVLLYLFYPQQAPEQEVREVPLAEQGLQSEPTVLPAAEDIPRLVSPEPSQSSEQSPSTDEQQPALPAPKDSDPLIREQLAAVGVSAELSGFDKGENLLQRLVALVDGASRGTVLRKILPMDAPQQAFPVMEVDGQLYMDEAGYERFKPYVTALTALNTQAMVSSFHQLRPLYEEAYGQLGLKPDDLDNAVIRILDRIIATPEIEEPIALESKSVMYSYADPELEALAPLQRQLLRTGPDNLRRIKAKASALREALLKPE